MIRFLARVAIMVVANATGLLIAWWLLPEFKISFIGFTLSILVFTGSTLLLEPFILKMAIKYLPALRGGIALVTTFIGLFLTALFTDGLRIESLTAWFLAPLIVWAAVVVMGIVLPLFMFKNALRETKKRRSDAN